MELWQAAEQYLGVPFLHAGRTRAGLDCAGLLVLAARDIGIELTGPEHYGREPNRENNAFDLDAYGRRNFGEPVTRDPRPNDIVSLKIKPHWVATHIGIIAPHPYGLGILHSHARVGRVVFHRLDDRYRSKVFEVFECPQQAK